MLNNANVGATAIESASTSVNVVNKTSDEGVDFNFTLPPGAKGDIGEPGFKGDTQLVFGDRVETLVQKVPKERKETRAQLVPKDRKVTRAKLVQKDPKDRKETRVRNFKTKITCRSRTKLL